MNIVFKEVFAGVKELVKEKHEENGQAVADKQLDHQQRCAHIFIEVRLEEVPEGDEEEVLDKAAAIVEGQLAPVLLLFNKLSMGEV